MKKKGVLLLMTLAALGLTACQNRQGAQVKKSSGSAVVKQTKNNGKRHFGTRKTGSHESEDNWDDTKQDKLDNFFDAWAKTMKQSYDKYDGDGQIETAAGEKFPQDFDKVKVNGNKASLAYHPNGEGDADYNVVAIYNYDKGEAASHITYFFAFHDNQPIVLVDETTNGDYVQTKETANQDLIHGFADIAAGKNAYMTDSGESSTAGSNTASSTNNETEDPKLIGVFVGLLKNGDWFKDQLKRGHMYFGTNWSEKGKIKGYDYITANGDPTSYYWFKQEGNNIVIKFVDISHAKSVATAPVKTEVYAISRLKNDYYVNSGQKAEVDSYVSRLKNE